ncbi:MAG: hypothetical protein ACKJSG_13255 [Lentisphaeria bacterium]
MKRVDHGILNCGEAGTARAISTFPSFAVLTDKPLFATYRVGTTKDSEDRWSRCGDQAMADAPGASPKDHFRRPMPWAVL